MMFNDAFNISICSWILYWILVYCHFKDILPNPMIKYVTNHFEKYETLDTYKQISFLTSMTHALLSFILSLYLFCIIPSNQIINQTIYHVVVGISISYYTMDLLIVGYYLVDWLFFVHHVMANILIITFYMYGHHYQIIYPFSMILAELTNPLQLTFTYLMQTKQTKTPLFFVVSTVFTYLFTFLRCLLIPIIYSEQYHNFYKVAEFNTIHAIMYNIALFSGFLGSAIWNLSIIKGYYNKVFLPTQK